MTMGTENAYAVIMAGGGGTRLWPKSRQKTPKHLLKLFGDETLIRITYKRIAGILPNNKIFVITHKNHADQVYKELPELPKENILIEPEARNTGLAMTTASACIHEQDKNASIIFLPADHIYKDIKKFQDTFLSALDATRQGEYIVQIGIKPTFPHTGLGYIKIGAQIGHIKVDGTDEYAFKVEGFKEKPDLATATSFLASGQYLWNAGLYAWKTETFINALKLYAPALYKTYKNLESEFAKGSKDVLGKIYPEAGEVNSIDYEVAEKASNIIVIPGDFGWSDIGDWKVVYDSFEKGENGNVILGGGEGECLQVENRNCFIETNGRLVAAIGLENIVIIDTKDALLICNKDRSQDVKKIVEKLKAEKKDEYL